MSELRTDVLKDGAGTGSPSFPNGLEQADIADAVNAAGAAPIFGCRAWVNFDGTRNVDDTGASTNGQPVLIRASGNVTSVVKNSVGNYTVNFTTAMEDVNYATHVSAATASNGTNVTFTVLGAVLTTSVAIRQLASGTGGGGDADVALFCVAVFR